MGATDNSVGGSYGARHFGPADWESARWRRRATRWTPFDIVAMVLGFIVFWPIGLAILLYKGWQLRNGGPDLQALAAEKGQVAWNMFASTSWGQTATRYSQGFTGPGSGNAAFDQWRAAELARLDEERRKLDDAQRDFQEYVDAIRKAKDREEFDRFMAERRNRPTGGPQNG